MRSSSKPSNGAFQLVGLTKHSDWSGTDQSGRGVLSGRQKGAFRLVGLTKRSDWSGTEQSGRGVLRSRQKEDSDWSTFDKDPPLSTFIPAPSVPISPTLSW